MNNEGPKLEIAVTLLAKDIVDYAIIIDETTFVVLFIVDSVYMI